MARLGMLYAITDEALAQLEAQDIDQMYDYMLEEIEEELFDTPEAFEINKAWQGVQFCLGEGTWNEENKVPYNVVFGEFGAEIPYFIPFEFGVEFDPRAAG